MRGSWQSYGVSDDGCHDRYGKQNRTYRHFEELHRVWRLVSAPKAASCCVARAPVVLCPMKDKSGPDWFWLLKGCAFEMTSGLQWPTPGPGPVSVRYHALALCLRVGGGTILPTPARTEHTRAGSPRPTAPTRSAAAMPRWPRAGPRGR
jgi:hypothetical protein